MRRIHLWFDGGSKGNPGKGYGSYEVDGGPDLKHKSLRQQFGDSLTNNQAEYLALLAGLKWLGHHLPSEPVHLLIYSDSKLVVMQVQGSWKVRCLHMKELVKEVHDYLKPYAKHQMFWHDRTHNLQRFGH